jgi:hypothetical protein
VVVGRRVVVLNAKRNGARQAPVARDGPAKLGVVDFQDLHLGFERVAAALALRALQVGQQIGIEKTREHELADVVQKRGPRTIPAESGPCKSSPWIRP